MNQISEQDLVILPPKGEALAIFTTDGAIEPFLDRVREIAEGFVGDVSTPAGRKKIASLAHRVSKAKVALEKVGDELAKEQKEIPKLIDATRRHIKETLDALRDEIRAPLDEWEAAADARKAILEHWQALPSDLTLQTAAALRDAAFRMRDEEVSVERFGDYAAAAAEIKETAIAELTARLCEAEKREAEQAELEQLRKEKAEREKAEEAERLRKEGEERARLDAEADLRAQAAASRAREEQLQKDKEAAEQRAVEAARNAKRELEAQKIEEDRQRKEREADRDHRRAVNTAALKAFVAGGLAEDDAKLAVTLIARGEIPAISINY